MSMCAPIGTIKFAMQMQIAAMDTVAKAPTNDVAHLIVGVILRLVSKAHVPVTVVRTWVYVNHALKAAA